MRKEEIKDSFDTGKLKHVNLSISTSRQMTDGKFSGRIVRTPEENPDLPNLLDTMAGNVQLAKRLGAHIVGVNAEGRFPYR